MRTINEKEMTQIQGGAQSGFNVETPIHICQIAAPYCMREKVNKFQNSLYGV